LASRVDLLVTRIETYILEQVLHIPAGSVSVTKNSLSHNWRSPDSKLSAEHAEDLYISRISLVAMSHAILAFWLFT
jgi:hypothetical protein